MSDPEAAAAAHSRALDDGMPPVTADDLVEEKRAIAESRAVEVGREMEAMLRRRLEVRHRRLPSERMGAAAAACARATSKVSLLLLSI